VELKAGLVVLKAQHPGSSNFVVELILPTPGVDPSRGYDASYTLINEIGQYNGGAATSLRKDGSYLVRVDARGGYQVTLEQPAEASDDTAWMREFSGKGQQVTPVFALPSGPITLHLTHDGKRNFQVWLYEIGGGTVGGQLVNQTGPVDETIRLDVVLEGPHLFHVKADGNWTIMVDVE
jgi:hypothetical protein